MKLPVILQYLSFLPGTYIQTLSLHKHIPKNKQHTRNKKGYTKALIDQKQNKIKHNKIFVRIEIYKLLLFCNFISFKMKQFYCILQGKFKI